MAGGCQEREVLPLPEFSDGIADTAVPMRGRLSRAYYAV